MSEPVRKDIGLSRSCVVGKRIALGIRPILHEARRVPQQSARRTGLDGAPAIGIEARKGRDPACRGSVRSTRARARRASPPEKEPENPSRGHGPSCPGADADELQRIGPAAVRAPLHAPEVAPELRRPLDRPHAPATQPLRSSVAAVELGDRLGRAADRDHHVAKTNMRKPGPHKPRCPRGEVCSPTRVGRRTVGSLRVRWRERMVRVRTRMRFGSQQQVVDSRIIL